MKTAENRQSLAGRRRKRDRVRALWARRPRGARRKVRRTLMVTVPTVALVSAAPLTPASPHGLPVAASQMLAPDDMVAIETAPPLAADLPVVEASYYGDGDGFAGKMTANGETFDPSLLTAAHKELPFDTLVEVTNTANGESVVVRINDRGPYHGERAIDLSTAAAEAIGMKDSGTGMVTMKVLSAA